MIEVIYPKRILHKLLLEHRVQCLELLVKFDKGLCKVNYFVLTYQKAIVFYPEGNIQKNEKQQDSQSYIIFLINNVEKLSLEHKRTFHLLYNYRAKPKSLTNVENIQISIPRV